MTTAPIVSVRDLHKIYGKAGQKQYEALKGLILMSNLANLSELWAHLVLGKPRCSIF